MIIVVTGASQGIGKVLATYLSDKGHTVYGFARRQILDVNFKSIQVDVTDKKALEDAFSSVYQTEKSIDCLINNAGMGISGSIEFTDPKDIQTLFDVNFMGLVYATQAVIPYLRKNQKSKIINIGSVAGHLAIPFQSFYSASKAAVTAFSEALYNEVSVFGIDVCTVLPGDIKTEFTKNRKKATDNELYQKRVEKSLNVMEKDEQSGYDPIKAAKVIYKLIKKRKMPRRKTIGFKYKVFMVLNKVFPKRIVVYVIGKIYGFKKIK